MNLSGWGRYPRVNARVFDLHSVERCRAIIRDTPTVLARGMGRSYGDSSLGPSVISTLKRNCLLAFDAQTGLVTCESGVTLAELIDAFLYRGWFLPVTPGTKFVTVGGAIASDVHGKNHHEHGCFSEFVESFEIILATGEIRLCSKTHNAALFHATCGGMGLTGIVLQATIQLRRVPSAHIEETTFRAANLDEVLALLKQHRTATYAVAWIDCLAKGDAMGRSLLTLGEHAPDGGLVLPQKRSHTMPFELPRWVLNRHSIALFNQFYFNRSGHSPLRRRIDLDTFFYPLDAMLHWNRMYGSRGLLQYQCVLPEQNARDSLHELLATITQSGLGSCLAVLKWLGPCNKNLLSFPLEGVTLALDFRHEPSVFSLLDRLDAMVVAAGGRVYLTKDARMSVNTFRSGYPRWSEFRAFREANGLLAKFSSLQAVRLQM